MTVLIIIAIVAAVLGALVLRPMLKIRLTYNETDGLGVTARYLFVSKTLLPRVKHLKLKDYSRKNHEKALKKKRKKAAKKQKRKNSSDSKKKSVTAKKRKINIKRLFPTLLRITKRISTKFIGKLHIDIARIRVIVATGDAAETAITYGAVAQSLAYFLEFVDSITNLKTNKKSEISVNADFLSEKTTADIDISFRLSVGNVVSNGVYLAFEYLKHRFFNKNEDKKTNTKASKTIKKEI